jgi:hypothetical protein
LHTDRPHPPREPVDGTDRVTKLEMRRERNDGLEY